MVKVSQALLLLLASCLVIIQPVKATFFPRQSKTKPQQEEPVDLVSGEGFDYATRVLRDPWDMQQFSDVSMWINRTADETDFQDLKVENGVFSALTGEGLSYFFVLFGGYEPGLNHGKTGELYPIRTGKYACFYMAMKAQAQGQANYQVFWTDKLIPSQVEGMATNLPVLNGRWKLYQVDLRSWPHMVGTRFTDRPTWESLRIIPSSLSNTPFSIDWVRLTDCQPVEITLKNLPAGEYSFWVTADNPARQILIRDAFSPKGDGTVNLDMQGIEPGAYTYQVKRKSDGVLVQSGKLTIRPAPILRFNRPSAYSGEDYATSTGNAWDMQTSRDVSQFECVSYAFEDGLLKLDTVPPSQAPKGCTGAGAGEMDPILFLKTLQEVDIRDYRYLSFSHRIDVAWSLPELGTVARLFWGIHEGGTNCFSVSREVTLEPGWVTYTIDLYDAWNGMPVDVAPSRCEKVHWTAQDNPVFRFRFDPNENITDAVMHQEIDWIRLTKVDRIRRGQKYPVKVLLNIAPSQIRSIEFFYTSSLSEPMQRAAIPAENSQQDQAEANVFRLFIPFSKRGEADPFVANLKADIVYFWDTSGVSPGEYYLCARSSDGYNRSTYCSEAPVQVYSP